MASGVSRKQLLRGASSFLASDDASGMSKFLGEGVAVLLSCSSHFQACDAHAPERYTHIRRRTPLLAEE